MKLLVFAHTPPPHHGQSYMVQLMLDGLRDSEIDCFHVDARLSDDMADIGGMRLGKLLRLLKYCGQAIWLRFRHGIDTFYYVPAPAKRSAIYRDWLVLLLCRPFFKRLVLHWHAYGLGEWAESMTNWEKKLTHQLLAHADLSIVLAEFNRADAAVFAPKKIVVVPNGIPDPCPDFEQIALPQRQRRLAARSAESGIFRILFLAHCTRDKGLFDTLEAVALGNSQLSALNSQLRIHLTVAGSFMSKAERAEFDSRLSTLNSSVTYPGFITGEEKARLFRESDAFCFPTYYSGETFGLVIAEAMAFGLPILTTNWRGLPELLPPGYPWIVEPRSPTQLADALLQMTSYDGTAELRARFLDTCVLERHLAALQAAIYDLAFRF